VHLPTLYQIVEHVAELLYQSESLVDIWFNFNQNVIFIFNLVKLTLMYAPMIKLDNKRLYSKQDCHVHRLVKLIYVV
jgi:hypothetical protein